MFRNIILLFSFFLLINGRHAHNMSTDQITIQQKAVQLVRAIVLGDKKKLKKKAKQFFVSTHSQHLLTPSALHLSSLTGFILFFFKLNTRKRTFFSLCLSAPFIFQSFAISLKRIAMFHLSSFVISSLFSKIFHQFTRPLSFLIFFLFDFLWGTKNLNYLSFSLSFLFLGIIYSAKGKRDIILSFFCAQIFISFILSTPFYPIGAIIGLILTPLVSPIVPLAIISFIFNDSLSQSFFLWIEKLVSISSTSSLLQVKVQTPSILFIVAIFFLTRTFQNKKTVLFLFSFLMTHQINTSDKVNRYWNKIQVAPHFLKIMKISNVKDGYRIEYSYGIKCREKLFNSFWANKCNTRKKLKKKIKRTQGYE